MASGSYGGTAGYITLASSDGNIQIMAIPDGATSVTFVNSSSGTQILDVFIPGIQRTLDGYAPDDVTQAQWAQVLPPVIGVLSSMTFTLRPNGIKEVWAKTTAGSNCTASFGVSEKSLVTNYNTRRSYK
tara:strand:- start:2721 stop:3107 length:387 start_codon:yes stop_codon:yes gene_type:complete